MLTYPLQKCRFRRQRTVLNKSPLACETRYMHGCWLAEKKKAQKIKKKKKQQNQKVFP